MLLKETPFGSGAFLLVKARLKFSVPQASVGIYNYDSKCDA